MNNLAMSFHDAVRQRRSTRQFLPMAVPDYLIWKVLEDAQCTPSNCNIQPWTVHILSGAKRDELSRLLLADEEVGRHTGDFTFDDSVFTGVYAERLRKMGRVRFQAVNIAREDKEARKTNMIRNLSFYGAPHVALLFMPPIGDNVRTGGDIGMYAQTFLLSLTSKGLAGVPQTLLGMYAETVREFLGIGPELKMMFDISFGYADPDAPDAHINVGRVPLSESVVVHE